MPAGVVLVLVFGLLFWRGIRIGDLSQQILSAAKAPAFDSKFTLSAKESRIR